MTHVLEFDRVTKSFPRERRTVLDHASFSLDAGEFVVLEGPSGSGKSTTIHLVAALDRPNSGGSSCTRRDIAKHHHHIDRYRREGVGVIFQLHNLLPHLSVLQNVEVVMLGTKVHRHARVERAHELLEAVGLAAQAASYPPELSGGERQRVAVARAFANDPPLVLADEPTNSLDDETAATVIELLRDRCSSGGAVLAVSHDQRLTRAADRVLRLADGHVTEVARTVMTSGAQPGTFGTAHNDWRGADNGVCRRIEVSRSRKHRQRSSSRSTARPASQRAFAWCAEHAERFGVERIVVVHAVHLPHYTPFVELGPILTAPIMGTGERERIRAIVTEEWCRPLRNADWSIT